MLEVSGLALERGGRRLFSGIDLQLRPGELLRVRGRNGSGKTSLLRVLAGLSRPAAGQVRWRGEPIDDGFNREMLFLGHAAAIKDELTVLENLEFSARLSGLEGSGEKALKSVGISHLAGLPARFLSQGQRKRVALARLALAASVPLWLLDEPLAALDDEAIRSLTGLCEQHLSQGGLVVLTSHQDVAISAPQKEIALA